MTGNDKLTCFYNAYDNYIGLVYMNKTSSPYDIRFNYLSLSTPVSTPSQYVYVYPGGAIYMYSGAGFNKP